MESESAKQVTLHESPDSNGSQNADAHTSKARNKKSWSGLLAGIAVIVALVGALLSFWSMNSSIQSVNNLKSIVAQKDSLLAQHKDEIDRLMRNQRNLRDELDTRLAAGKAEQENLGKTMKHFGESLDALGLRIGKNTSTWMVAEAEYLLTVANHRVLLEGDVLTAIEALTAADQRLKQVGDPALFRVRKLIADERNALKSVSLPDFSGIVFELTTLASIIQELPLIITEKSSEIEKPLSIDQSKDLSNAFVKLWEDIKGLVVVRRHDQPVTPLLPPDQRLFLLQNLRLKIESARLAILRSDPTNFNSNLSEAKNWLTSYFDRSNAGVIRFNETLDRLMAINIVPELPVISGSLTALQSIRAQDTSNKAALIVPNNVPKKNIPKNNSQSLSEKTTPIAPTSSTTPERNVSESQSEQPKSDFTSNSPDSIKESAL